MIKSQQLLAAKKNGVLDVLSNLGRGEENLSMGKPAQKRSVLTAQMQHS
jgi:hypothetical protein